MILNYRGREISQYSQSVNYKTWASKPKNIALNKKNRDNNSFLWVSSSVSSVFELVVTHNPKHCNFIRELLMGISTTEPSTLLVYQHLQSITINIYNFLIHITTLHLSFQTLDSRIRKISSVLKGFTPMTLCTISSSVSTVMSYRTPFGPKIRRQRTMTRHSQSLIDECLIKQWRVVYLQIAAKPMTQIIINSFQKKPLKSFSVSLGPMLLQHKNENKI